MQPNQTLSPREEKMTIFRDIVNELSISECMHLKGYLAQRENELMRRTPKTLEEPKRFLKWMCKRFGIQMPDKTERTDFNVTNIWLCIVHNLITQKGISIADVAKIINRSDSGVRKAKAEYERLYHIVFTDDQKAVSFKADKKEFLIALREYNNLK